LHFHLHFDASGVEPRPIELSGTNWTILLPQHASSGTTKVRGTASGYICAQGRVTTDVDQVYGIILRSGAPIPSGIPSGAILATLTTSQATQPGGPSHGANFFFRHDHNNELPGAKCNTGSGDADNVLYLIGVLSGTVVDTAVHSFLGVCGSSTDCQGSGALAASLTATTTAAPAAPRVYRVEIPHEAGVRQSAPVLLRMREDLLDQGEMVWESVEDNPASGVWTLRVVGTAAARAGVLTQSIARGPRCTWFTSSWHPGRANRLHLEPASGVASAAVPTFVVISAA
jgi:hypothetical protein